MDQITERICLTRDASLTSLRAKLRRLVVTRRLREVVFPLAVGLAMGLAGCAAVESVGKTPEEQVTARATARLKLLLAGKVDDTYEFLSPGSKAVTSLDRYRNRVKPSFWNAADVILSNCSGEVCEVKVKVVYTRQGFGDIDTVLSEKWIKEQGRWWYVYPQR